MSPKPTTPIAVGITRIQYRTCISDKRALYRAEALQDISGGYLKNRNWSPGRC